LASLRVAIISDVHGNLTALEAVAKDIERQGVDLVLQGGDLGVIGSRPHEAIELIRDRGWSGVLGNTDEILFDTSSQPLQERRAPKLQQWLGILFQTLAPWACERISDSQIGWLRSLPLETRSGDLLLIHAAPSDLWRAPMPDATDQNLWDTYGECQAGIVVYGHIHRPYTRSVRGMLIANPGAVGLPYDGDWRASYLLLDGDVGTIRRVDYDIDRACRDLNATEFPLASWLEAVLRTGRFRQP
jgi:putative phosphoesterase